MLDSGCYKTEERQMAPWSTDLMGTSRSMIPGVKDQQDQDDLSQKKKDIDWSGQNWLYPSRNASAFSFTNITVTPGASVPLQNS